MSSRSSISARKARTATGLRGRHSGAREARTWNDETKKRRPFGRRFQGKFVGRLLLRGYVRRVVRQHVDDAGVGGDFAFSFDGADADSGVVGVGEADAAQEGVDLAEFVGLELNLGDGGDFGVGGDDGDLELDRFAGDFGEADVGAEAVGFFDLEDLEGSGAEAGGFVGGDAGDELAVGAAGGLVVGTGSLTGGAALVNSGMVADGERQGL